MPTNNHPDLSKQIDTLRELLRCPKCGEPRDEQTLRELAESIEGLNKKQRGRLASSFTEAATEERDGTPTWNIQVAYLISNWETYYGGAHE